MKILQFFVAFLENINFKCNVKKTLAPLCVGGTFWNYVYDKDRYNFTQEQFVNESERDIRTFVQFVVNATRDYVNVHLKIRSVHTTYSWNIKW